MKDFYTIFCFIFYHFINKPFPVSQTNFAAFFNCFYTIWSIIFIRFHTIFQKYQRSFLKSRNPSVPPLLPFIKCVMYVYIAMPKFSRCRGISHQFKVEINIEDAAKEWEKAENIWKTRFREFLWSCFWASTLSALVCPFLLFFFVCDFKKDGKTINFFEDDAEWGFINCVTNFKPFICLSMPIEKVRQTKATKKTKKTKRIWSEESEKIK